MTPESTPLLLQLVGEVLSSPIPYQTTPADNPNGAYYFVCDYRRIPKGTVLVYSRPFELGVHIHGYLPQASQEERETLRDLLARQLSPQGALAQDGLPEVGLRVLSESEGVQRLIEVRQLMSIARAGRDRPVLH